MKESKEKGWSEMNNSEKIERLREKIETLEVSVKNSQRLQRQDNPFDL